MNIQCTSNTFYRTNCAWEAVLRRYSGTKKPYLPVVLFHQRFLTGGGVIKFPGGAEHLRAQQHGKFDH